MHEHGSDSGSARRTVEIGDDRMLRVGGSTAVFDRHDSTSLLTSYLLLVRKLRKQRREPAVVLRSDDIVVLASYLGEPAAVVIERLGALMGATRTQRTAMVTLFASGALVIGLATAATATGTVRGGTSASHASAPADREATPSTAAPMATGDGADGGEAATAAVVFVDRYDDGGTSDGPSAGLDDRGTSQNRKGRRGAARADDARTADPPAPPADDPAFTGSDEPADPTSTPPVSSGPDDTEPASPASESPHLAAPPTIAAPSPTEVGNDPAPASNDESGNDGSGNDGSGDDGSGTDEEDDSPLVTIDPISEVDPAAPTDESTNPPTDEGPAAGGTDSTCGPMDR